MTDVHLYVHHSSPEDGEEVTVNTDEITRSAEIEDGEDEANIVRGLD
ncbi:hypothetical protein H7X46_27305 [Pseudonocardia sp. C8]|nr:hypothetical protein [Pseudonocardia sp. C8]MBC3194764.1 hypothetical protein [Pseudonocardia sp. C8]